ncbi:erythromycin esterase family protein [Deinococcus maricopensis]|uniref:Erythromycin esterase n=1 Tax=Deinococcus maricopensis (strain DSM 21211 / LMG 22137 / NRRL B-23946 / LB-34) TaxID=709986 RepID=E8UA41_DEIML|nr:erythromycin esterase family protein [Deinococcus maricopensis]ADV67930.1 Erythromycin esterase [Deinococcus maricopensis DSM 21211]
MNDEQLTTIIAGELQPVTGASGDYDALLDRIGDARFVLIGEASHGTHDFYRERARLTRRLIEERGFTAVIVEADWPDAYRVNRYVLGEGDDASALDALGDFTRFPKWMWRNEDVQHFAEWLRGHNTRSGARVGFYGMDLYSMHRSMHAVIEYLEGVDPEAARRARGRYACFEPYGEDPQTYGMSAAYGIGEPCEDAAVQQFLEVSRLDPDGGSVLEEDEHFYAEQNARLALNAERYYRSMFRGRDESWNLRDTHMTDTIAALARHQEDGGRTPRFVVWAHNSHLGDARATEMGWRYGELNVGQLVRERWPRETFLLGLSTHSGDVLAADTWDAPGRRKRVRPGLPGSVEALLHAAAGERAEPNFWLDLRASGALADALHAERLQRFIGVIYRPDTERQSHYVHTRVAEEYDALLYFDETSALVPLDRTSGAEDADELPDTYPAGL